ncbi:MAG: glutamine synthetase III [Oscillospiraceae bacterium]|jgi:glutamine synthetase|nr:glutamine synthetase III [Oscillospiraceae bacterium]
MALAEKTYGSKAFTESVMKERLPKSTFKALKKAFEENKPIPAEIADIVASAMKDWATEQGATHYTHWFQPMTGITAEKHDSFISPNPDGTAIFEFSGKELIKGEPDASSFPSGGLRATFEARGYTVWDPTSYAFVKDDTLYIPTAFYSYSGEALDKKTPLLRSMDAVSKQAVRVLKLFGKDDVNKVVATVGAEQEYFLIDREHYAKRKDLVLTGRTLFGQSAPKGQELEDHYFGTLKQRVSDFMKDLDNSLWELGIPSKTKHNEVAPSQHECAPVFESANLAADHNQLTMELMKKIAKKHGYACLLHEKPFAGVNGSGKHDNWSLSTDKGQNLLDPGKNPIDNAQFLTFLAAIVAAVDDYAVLLRLSVATAGNDHRLGANEAPPAVVSIFLGEELLDVVEALIEDRDPLDKNSVFKVGVSSLPSFPKDTTDRNRTSPFAFTGNKFEFRMLGSNLNIAGPNIILNTIVAEKLDIFAERLEKAEAFDEELKALLKETFNTHKRIIFNGNGYDDNWLEEAAKRGLPNIPNAAEAIPHFKDAENIRIFTKHGVFSDIEVHSRTDILIENYVRTVNIEALTAIDIAQKEILPACRKYQLELAKLIKLKRGLDIGIDTTIEADFLRTHSEETDKLAKAICALTGVQVEAVSVTEIEEQAKSYQTKVIPALNLLREIADGLECYTPAEYWPIPTYTDILFSAK